MKCKRLIIGIQTTMDNEMMTEDRREMVVKTLEELEEERRLILRARKAPGSHQQCTKQRRLHKDDDDFYLDGFRNLLWYLGEDVSRQGLQETPERVLKAIKYLCSGYHEDPSDHLKLFDDGACDTLVFQGNIPVYSLCEHHMMPIFGYAHVGYIPNGKIIGLSKIYRIVDIFAKRLQVQERLTSDIANFLHEGLAARGVGVVVHARHMCMEMRGIQRSGTVTVTNSMLGVFRDNSEVRSEFMTLVPAITHSGVL